ncbi:MAG: ATP-binding protein [Marmoricola sp.]
MAHYAGQPRQVVLGRIRNRVAAAPTVSEQPWLEALWADLGDEVIATEPDASPLGRLAPRQAELLVAAGLIETDIRFGALFATLQEPMRSRRPCIGLLAWLLSTNEIEGAELTAECHELVRRGLFAVENTSDPRAEWVVRVPVPIWDLLATGRCDPASLPDQITFRARDTFPALAEVAVAENVTGLVARLPGLLAAGDGLSAVVVRGMTGSGRTTVLGAVANTLGLDLLVYEGDPKDPAWQLFGALAALWGVLPVVRCDPGPGETVTIPAPLGRDRPIGVVAGRSGGITGPPLEHAVVVTLGSCGPDDRRRLWSSGGLDERSDDLEEVVERFLLTPGNICRTAPLAILGARAAGRERITVDDVQAATRALRRQELETLATHLDPLPLSAAPVLSPAAAEELATLVRRCRHRERLVIETTATHAGLNRGVRALFAGGSGTGKTLAARHLAATLHLDLYRVDLAAVVNKYIGETERNLDRVLARAEELDVVLLLDEGDALMTRRTDVANANDRYANLETNFLLQRLETFDGIVVVTSNAAGRIDPAFLRRIDVTIDFVPPDAEQRLQIWSSHLPVNHEVDPSVLQEVARRCSLTGGQIRNAALHATLLALDHDSCVTADDLLEAVRREYRRGGAAYPMGERSGVRVPVW